MLTKETFKDQEYISAIKRYLRNQGFCCDAYKPSYLQRRIQVRLRARQLDSFGEYLRILRTDSDEYRQLLDALTINVTQFFRDPDVFQSLREQIIPGFVADDKSGRTTRIWSAGCSSGEEPYSIAILLWEALSNSRNNCGFVIYATDIDKKSFDAAKKGAYRPEKLEKLPDEMKQKYFTLDGKYQVKDDLKFSIRFKRSDLLTDKGIKFCNLIVCRNVLIYFNRKDQEKVVKLFHESLQPSGYLILGKTEVLPSGFYKQFICVDRKAHIYRKA